jgi:hypothetical protein
MVANLVNTMNPKRTLRRFTAAFKAAVALAALIEWQLLAALGPASGAGLCRAGSAANPAGRYLYLLLERVLSERV